jgi:hypothetical protein
MKRALVVCALLSCKKPVGHSSAPPIEDAHPEIATIADAAKPTLETHAVTDTDFARRVHYTWTTPQQVEALRSGNRLLVATSYAGSGPSRYILDLEDLVRAKSTGLEIARALLLHPSLSRRRYAWPSPFATRMGLSGKTYGDALIRVVLKPDSLFVRFHPEEKDPFTVVDSSGHAATFEAGRVGAVFHVRTSKTATAPFREYVLCNEEQIERYEVGTDIIRAELEAEKELLRTLVIDDRSRELWRQAIAFDNERYSLVRENLEAIVTSLGGYDETGPPLVRP